MNRFSAIQCVRAFRPAVAACLLALALPVLAHEVEEKIPDPGFRPGSEYAATFLDVLDNVIIAVYPTIVRRANRTAHSLDSRAQIVDLLDERNIAAALSKSHRVKFGALEGDSQWDVFLKDRKRIADDLKTQESSAEYHLFLEFLLPVSDDAIFGVHCYILDQQGNNAFSFLLNSHHQLFVDANLVAGDSSEEARSAMMARATDAAIHALQAQIHDAREHAVPMATIRTRKPGGRVFDNFESGLPTGTDPYGLDVGFVTFTDGTSTAGISTTDAHPPLPDEAQGNHVLQLDLDVKNWAGFVHAFLYQGEASNSWAAYDWRAFDGFSFWLYGNNSGTSLFIDVLDNRNPGSTKEDAERYTYAFTDDFSGWRPINVRFTDMRRKEVGNGAPVDGLGLSAVHGWAFGTGNTGGPVTWYIDDFTLHGAKSGAGPPVTDVSKTDYPINELPMYGLREKTAKQKRADKKYIRTMTKGGRSRAEAAESAARVGWNFFYAGDKSTAIKRFNQAWLLDPENQLALWGFAVTSIDRGQIEEAVRYYRMAIDAGPENLRLQGDYEIALNRLEQ